MNEMDDDLKKIIEQANQEYFNSSSSSFDDDEYDQLEKLYQDRTKERIELTRPVSGKLCELPVYMGSLSKFRDEIPDGFKTNIVVTPKLDGCSVLYHQYLRQKKLYSRGNGYIAQDISHLLEFLNLPEIPDNTAVRGELIVSKSDFQEHVVTCGYKVARNYISGVINSCTTDTLNYKYLKFIAYEFIQTTNSDQLPFSEQYEILKSLKFQIVPYEKAEELSKSLLSDKLNDFRKVLNYEVDGLVLSKNMKYIRSSSRTPDYQIAFKQNLLGTITIVNSITWIPSRTSRLIPVLQIQPININGCTISKVTGHNYRWLVERKIGKGSVVTVIRSGEVIPQVEKVILSSEDLNLPFMDEIHLDETGTHLILPDDTSTNKVKIRQIEHLINTLSVKQLGIQRITEIYNHGYTEFHQFLVLKPEDIEFLGKKLSVLICDNLRTAIQSATLPVLISGTGHLGTGIGCRKLEALFQAYPDLLDLKTDLRSKILELDGFAERTTDQIIKGIQIFKTFFASLPIEIKNSIISNTDKKFKHEDNTVTIKGKFLGQKILLTGFRDADLQLKIQEAGGTIVSSISTKINILIVKNIDTINNKTKFALEHGIKIITYSDFMNQMVSSVSPAIKVIKVKPFKLKVQIKS